ncbi:hypothetical protein AHF37_10632 [Paragonimus kellicotti]|nr:hypothetical protein AHF37_10632 [Paragonimus kellicotti]
MEIDERLYTIPKKIRAETRPEAVFSFIADTIHDFLVIRGLQNQSFDLAFCFNFPVQMFSISKAHLISWAKEFGCDSVIGQDVCGLLQQALNALSLKVKISAVFNDTVGVLAACAAKDPECGIGLIVSAGTNCCYFERGSRIQKPFAKFACGQELIINTEWGGFGDSGTLQQFMTKYDKEIDAATLTPGKQM